MIVLVCGGREFEDYAALRQMLDAVHLEMGPIVKIVSGAARGADSLGEYWAHQNAVPVARYPPDWSTHGRRAGLIRNAEMLQSEPVDLVVACRGGRGTADMIRRATAQHLPIMRVG